ncbi:PREDICTED: putative defensin-like protein 262 [Camelina sativa]|uniref:Defensin-like protein 262 n=1 Tax=Camelina sativa TaxID=90675 RepID=A0ABM1R2T2_CAMSA|nr:PREDICTED: putative defensin-like protein 262 [Camelina sativa]
MEKTSLKLVFLLSLIVIAFCSCLGDAREMMVEEVSCIEGKCPEGMKNCNCLPQRAHIERNDYGQPCDVASDCDKFCPSECKPETCSCSCDFGCTCTCY